MTSSELTEQPHEAGHGAVASGPHRSFTVRVSMGDGCELETVVYLPATGGACPTIFMRTVYGITEVASASEAVGQAGAAQGYATVIQDARGRHGSAGDFALGAHDRQDARDTLDWIVDQEWCDGTVVLRGDSAGGLLAWHAAAAEHPSVTGLVVGVTGGVFGGFGYYARGVVQPETLIGWVGNLMMPDRVARTGITVTDPHWRALIEGDTTPLLVALLGLGPGEEVRAAELMQQMTDRAEGNRRAVRGLASDPAKTRDGAGDLMPWVAQWLAHPDPEDAFWAELDYSDTAKTLRVPGLHIAGWHDMFVRGAIRNYVNAARAGLAPQRLVVNPYTHYGSGAPVGSWTPPLAPQPDGMSMVGTTPAPAPDLVQDWLARHLRGTEPSGTGTEAPISLYVQRADTWRDEWEWPLARTEWTPLYLDSDGAANTAAGDGALLASVPPSERADHFTYDPDDPVPSAGGTHLGAYWPAGIFDQRVVEERADVLVYTSEPYEEGLEVTGPVSVTLYVATSAVDTDFTAKLTDVDTGGVSTNVCDGVTRLRFRTDAKGPVKPGSRQRVEIELSPTSYYFARGHRVRLQVSSSNFPLQQPNSNTGRNEWMEPVTPVVARQTVSHGGPSPSALLLPVIPADPHR